MFLSSLMASFLSRTSANTFSRSIFHKHKRLKNFNFLTKIMDYPLCKNSNFVGFWNPCFHCSERLVRYIKSRKSFFCDSFSRSMTWENRGLQGVTWGYKGLLGVTRGYRGLQGVKRCDRGWHAVTGGYKGLYKIFSN